MAKLLYRIFNTFEGRTEGLSYVERTEGEKSKLIVIALILNIIFWIILSGSGNILIDIFNVVVSTAIFVLVFLEKI